MALDVFMPSVGNDPEIFIKNEEGRIIPSETFLGDYEKVKIDNAAVELQPGPSECLQVQNKFIGDTLEIVQTELRNKIPDSSVSLRPTEEIEQADINKLRSVCMFGCQPSLVFDGKSLRRSVPVADPRKVRHRSIGYHVHLGYARPEMVVEINNNWKTGSTILHTTEGRVRLVQMCDALVALPAVLLERDSRVPIRRQTLGYGQAGEFREQPHGFEYRTLGSWPLLHPMWGWWANGAVRDCLNIVVNDQDGQIKEGIDMLQVAEAINTNNIEQAFVLWNKIRKNLAVLIPDWMDYNVVHMDACHPLLSKDNLRKFEFLALQNDLAKREFNFKLWCENTTLPSGGHTRNAYYQGFPEGSTRRIGNDYKAANWEAFYKEWSLDKDLRRQDLVIE